MCSIYLASIVLSLSFVFTHCWNLLASLSCLNFWLLYASITCSQRIIIILKTRIHQQMLITNWFHIFNVLNIDQPYCNNDGCLSKDTNLDPPICQNQSKRQINCPGGFEFALYSNGMLIKLQPKFMPYLYHLYIFFPDSNISKKSKFTLIKKVIFLSAKKYD